MEHKDINSILSASYRKMLIRTVLACVAVTIPAVLAEFLLFCMNTPLFWLLAASALLAVCVGYGFYIEIKTLLLARRTEQTLEDACVTYGDLFLQEEFSSMELEEKSNYALSCLTDYTQSEYESTLLTKEAELFALQAQINPHFLYNTLDSIRGQAIVDGATEIANTIEALSNLFKYNISQKEALIPLRQEIDNLIYYMKIQKYRYIDKIDLLSDIEDDEILNTRIPKLTLQPIIENAIYHGLEPKLGKGAIKLHVFTAGNQLRMTITDDGVGMDEETLIRIKRQLCSQEPERLNGKASHGIALRNVHKRIQQCFGPRYGVNIYSTQMLGTRVELTFPYRKECYNCGDRSIPQ